MNYKPFDYNDINLIPKLCIVNSRSECDTSIKFGDFVFRIPVIPANMESVINEELAIKLAMNNYFYIMHRFNMDILKFIQKMKNLNLYTSISIGVNEDSYQLLDKLLKQNLIPVYITIDIAHGHCIKMEKMLKYLKENFKETFIIAGNVSTIEGTQDLEKWGADAIKVGIAPGSSCTTWNITGFGSRNIQPFIIQECSKHTNKPIIADGGIQNPSDINKSIVMGASMVMVGGMLSCFMDSPGKEVEKDGIIYKSFHGSASEHQSNKKNRIEGTLKLNKMKNIELLDYMDYLKECLQSSISYGGGNKLNDLYNVDYIITK